MENKPYSIETFNHRLHVGEVSIPQFIKKFKLTDLKNKVQEACKKSKATTGRPVVISFLMQKGGSGKSTSCVCLSQLMANLGLRTIVLDIDNQRSSYAYLNSRITNFSTDAQEAQQNNVPEKEFIKVKKSIDPFVDCEFVSQNTFSANWWSENLDRLQGYDIIFIDTPGNRTDEDDSGFNTLFDIHKAGFTGVSHITAALVSNVAILPTRQTGFDLDVFTRYCLAMVFFKKEMQEFRYAFCDTQIRTLVTQAVNRGSINDEFLKVKEQYSKYVPFLENSIGFSQKMGNLKDEAFASLFVRKNSILETWFLVADEVFDAVDESLKLVEGV